MVLNEKVKPLAEILNCKIFHIKIIKRGQYLQSQPVSDDRNNL